MQTLGRVKEPWGREAAASSELIQAFITHPVVMVDTFHPKHFPRVMSCRLSHCSERAVPSGHSRSLMLTGICVFPPD